MDGFYRESKKKDGYKNVCKLCCLNTQRNHRSTAKYKAYKKILDKNYLENNRGKTNAIKARYRANKLKATPSWSESKAIRAFYEACPVGYHVDHIVPLQGVTVRGLHVLANLQYLTASENCSKGNKYENN
jgi:hypothetical protein